MISFCSGCDVIKGGLERPWARGNATATITRAAAERKQKKEDKDEDGAAQWFRTTLF